jgi:hypothetical protein
MGSRFIIFDKRHVVQYVRYDCLPEMIYLVGSRVGLFKLIYFILFQ